MNIPEQFAHNFEPALLKEMELRARMISAKEGAVILDIGQTVRSIPLLLQGVLKITRIDEQGKELLLYYLHANESCAMTFTCCMQQYQAKSKQVPSRMWSTWQSRSRRWTNGLQNILPGKVL